MNIREMAEQREADYLSPYASLSRNSEERDRRKRPAISAPVYQRDRGRILHSKRPSGGSKHKTQVFLLPQRPLPDRLTHTLVA